MVRNLLAFCVCLIAIGSVCAAGEWNQWRGANRDGVDADSPALISALPDVGLKPLWVSEAIGSGNSGGWGSPVVAGGNVYLFAHNRIKVRDVGKRKFPWLPPEKRVGMSDDEYKEYEVNRRNEDEERAKAYTFRESIFCIDASSGKTVWNNETDSLYTRFAQSGSPTVLDGRLYILGAGRHARCLDSKTGKDIWKVRLPGDFRDEFWQSSFAIVDGTAVFLASHLYGLDVATGKILWQGDPDKTRGAHTSPVVWSSGDKQYVVVNVADSDTICVEPETGKELWRVNSEANLSTPVVSGNYLVTLGNSRQKGLRCFEISESGVKELWAFRGLADKGSSPVIVGDHVFAQGERRLACVDLKTGKSAWTASLDRSRPQYTSLIAADNKVIYALEGVLCFTATGESFEPLIDAKIDESGLMASEKAFRKILGLAELEKQPDGLQKSEKLYQQKVGRHGPLACATPAIANGRIYIRLKNAIACYDLRDRKTASAE